MRFTAKQTLLILDQCNFRKHKETGEIHKSIPTTLYFLSIKFESFRTFTWIMKIQEDEEAVSNSSNTAKQQQPNSSSSNQIRGSEKFEENQTSSIEQT